MKIFPGNRYLREQPGRLLDALLFLFFFGAPFFAKGDRIGMMKFGSRLDTYLPAGDVEVLVRPGDRVRAGETVVARTRTMRSKKEETDLQNAERI